MYYYMLGGPIYVRLKTDDDDDIEQLKFRNVPPRPKDRAQSESSEEDPTPWYMNGSNDAPRTAWDDEEDEDEAPPPPPPRNDELEAPPIHDDEAPPPLLPRNETEERVRSPRDETGEEEEEEEELEDETGHFLGVGRGGEREELPPLPPVPVRPPRDLVPPPLPVKMRKREREEEEKEKEKERLPVSNSFEEEALINELNELERLVEKREEKKEEEEEEEIEGKKAISEPTSSQEDLRIK